MTLTQGGNLLVGTTVNTLGKIQLEDSGPAILRLKTIGAGGCEVQLIASDGSLGIFGTTTNHAQVFITNNTERARITSGGYFKASNTGVYQGILSGYHEFRSDQNAQTLICGNTNANSAVSNFHSRFEVAGATGTHFEGVNNGTTVFRVAAGGQISSTSTTITAISDQRLKENVRDLPAGLEKINALKPRLFDWKEGKGRDVKDDRGFIAQEFETVFPDMVGEWVDGEDTYKALRADLIPVLVRAIQELSAQNTALTDRIAALEAAK
jgi:hypothetical protein